ncbi:hypothetical protein VC35_00300 [Pseudomonas fluorescens]|uniref:Uncharacterized protein n=1 Tax=Pseudomonas fluorescens TaxID=294 RepID=A0A0F4U358_PSEFL|nr:hypothetical protein VC35_00300 [Pseudomonas fluorescens]
MSDRTLYLGGQAAFTVEAMTFRGIGQGVAGEAIQGIIAITAIQDLSRGRHGDSNSQGGERLSLG